ncbi:TlpA family protein disulfide reductase [Shewanella sp. D64]|uniref:TlpA disulfide reductase family protein n=1 Tax=unclassified Shewanella TaxID=196818 RepID=UPI0022BA185C|nr:MULTISPECIES: TlpA disulfide reductase family protein [unclassified Shewanella]MEC4728794.1 TlpA family protein disulfide reductase [Shewanella sp. D64]MEC4740706.1 TlpA family protein disulfide reductase [Shewanella sp. E94]WBJ95228.1 TlpA family protein disulfide reductase [Shewanella sp. MTB7]
MKLMASLLKVSLLVLTCLSISSVSAYPGMQKQAEGEGQTNVGLISILPQPFPIAVVPFKNTQGEAVDFSQYKGKILMVNMWATWCPPCVRELPAISRLSEKFDKQEFAVLPISIDLEGKTKVEPFLKELGMGTFNSYYDETQNLSEVFPLDTIPATFILNRDGELIAFVRTFVDWDDKQAAELIQGFIDKR